MKHTLFDGNEQSLNNDASPFKTNFDCDIGVCGAFDVALDVVIDVLIIDLLFFMAVCICILF